MSYLPLISEALVKELKRQFPDRCPDPDWPEQVVRHKAGQASVVRWLERKMLDQQSETISMETEGG